MKTKQIIKLFEEGIFTYISKDRIYCKDDCVNCSGSATTKTISSCEYGCKDALGLFIHPPYRYINHTQNDQLVKQLSQSHPELFI